MHRIDIIAQELAVDEKVAALCPHQTQGVIGAFQGVILCVLIATIAGKRIAAAAAGRASIVEVHIEAVVVVEESTIGILPSILIRSRLGTKIAERFEIKRRTPTKLAPLEVAQSGDLSEVILTG